MNAYLRRAPWWILSLYNGVFFAAVMAVLFPILSPGQARHATFVFVVAVIGGIVFGAVMGPVSARQWASLNQAVGPLSDDTFRVVSRAAWRGPLPTDESIRSRAVALGSWRLSRIRPALILGLAVLEAQMAVMHALQLPEHLGQTVLFAALSAYFFWFLWFSLRLKNRVELMKATGLVRS